MDPDVYIATPDGPITHYDSGLWDDWPLHCHNQVTANEIIRRELDALSVTELIDVCKTYFCLTAKRIKQTKVSKTRRKTQTKRGGQPSGFDPDLYRLLELAELVHDFFTDEEPVAALVKDYQLPSGCTVQTLLSGPDFLTFITSHRTLNFSGKVVKNPLFKFDLVNGFKIQDSYETLDQMFEAAQRSVKGRNGNGDSKVCPMDVYTDCSKVAGRSSRVLKIHQIAQVCAGIRRFLGSDCQFQLHEIFG